MKPKDIKWCPQHGYPLPCNKCGMPLTQLQQEEIFEAGIREVVEWIENNHGDLGTIERPTITLNGVKWEAKLKEWGL